MKRIITILFIFAVTIGIFAPITFSVSSQGITINKIVAHATATSESLKQLRDASGVDGCGVSFFGGASIDGCFVAIFYWFPFSVGTTILSWSAKLLDYSASLTLSSKMFSQGGFLETGWSLMRDISNIFFIIILLYIALCMILDIHVSGVSEGDPKKLIWWVVLIAIVINFSMFFADLVIDVANTSGLIIYNQIGVPSASSSTDPNAPDAVDLDVAYLSIKARNPVAPKEISIALAQSFHPQFFADQNFWDSLKDNANIDWKTALQDIGVNTAGGAAVGTVIPGLGTLTGAALGFGRGLYNVIHDAVSGGTVAPGKVIAILVLLGCLFFIVAWSFFLAAFAFIGRMVELFVLVIFSPLAFVSIIVPKLRENETFGWDVWISKLLGIAFSAPVYFLFILLITLMTNSGFGGLSNIGSKASGVSVLIGSVIFPAVVLWQMLKKATDYVKNNTGDLGKTLSGGMEKGAKAVGAFGVGMAGMAATGGMAGAGGLAGMGGRMLGNSLAKTAASPFGSGKVGTAVTQLMKNKFNNGEMLKTKPDVKSSTPSGDSKKGGASNKFGGMALQATGSVIKGTGSAVKTMGNGVSKLGAVGKVVGGVMSTAGGALKGVGGGIKDKGTALRNIGKPTLNKDEIKQVRTEKTKRGNAIAKQKEKVDGKKKELKNIEGDVGGEKKKLKENNAKQKETEDSIKKDFNEGNHMMALGKESGNTEMFKKGQDLVKAAQKKESEYNKPFGAKESFENQKKFSEGKIKEGEAQIKQKKSELRDDSAVLKGLESGKKVKVGADGKVQRSSLGFAKTEPKLVYGNDPKTGKPNINPATGKPVTKTEALQTLSVKELASASKNSASSPVRERLGQKVAEGGKKQVTTKRDPLGSVKTVSSSSKPAVRSWSDDFAKSSQGAFAGNMTSTAGSNIPEIKVTVISPNAQPSAPAPAVNVITKNLNDSSSGKSKGGSGNSEGVSKPTKSSATMKNVNTTTVKEKSSTVVSGSGNASANIAVAFSQVVGDIKAAGGNVSSGATNYSAPSVSSGGSGSGNTKGGGEEYYSEPTAKSSPASSPASAPQKGK